MRWTIDNQLNNGIVIMWFILVNLISMYIRGTFIMKIWKWWLCMNIDLQIWNYSQNVKLYFLLFQLLLYLKDFSQKMISRVHEIEKEVDGLMHDSKVIKSCYND